MIIIKFCLANLMMLQKVYRIFWIPPDYVTLESFVQELNDRFFEFSETWDRLIEDALSAVLLQPQLQQTPIHHFGYIQKSTRKVLSSLPPNYINSQTHVGFSFSPKKMCIWKYNLSTLTDSLLFSRKQCWWLMQKRFWQTEIF